MAKDVRRDIANRDLGRALGRKIARLERHIRELETASQAAYRSVEDGALDFYDDDGVLRERIGKQADGSWGRVVKEGPIPPAPTEPDVQVISDGVVAITWDGRTEEKWPFAEFAAVRVHLVSDPVNEACDRDNQVGAIRSARGETIVAVTESDDDNPVYVRLVAVSTAGHTSDPSPAVLVDELDEDDLAEEEEELEFRQDGPWTVAAAGAQDFTLVAEPEQDSEHLYINGVEYDESDGWSRVGTTITVEAGLLRVDDVVKVEYATLGDGLSEELIPFAAGGYKYLPNVASSDTIDRSAPDFDDSSWATGTAPFTWTAGSSLKLWMRKTFPPARDLTLHLDIEDHGAIYVNGHKVIDLPYMGPGSANNDRTITYTIPNWAVNTDADNLIAVEAIDDNASVTYADINLWGVLT